MGAPFWSYMPLARPDAWLPRLDSNQYRVLRSHVVRVAGLGRVVLPEVLEDAPDRVGCSQGDGDSPVELGRVPVHLGQHQELSCDLSRGRLRSDIGLLNTEITNLELHLEAALAAHPKTVLLKALPRVAIVSLAALIAEIGPLIERCENPEQVAALCGAAPVTKASGKSRTVAFRYTANKPARVAITSFADNSRHSSAWAQDCYQRARSRGARHPHAIRILARGWVRVIWACWTTDIAYDPTRHHAEQQLATRT